MHLSFIHCTNADLFSKEFFNCYDIYIQLAKRIVYHFECQSKSRYQIKSFCFFHSKKKEEDTTEDEVMDSRQCEINYVKKFQSFQDHKLRLTTQDVSKLDKAKSKGKLHEAMLDRREKMKADRYCK